MIRRIRYYYGIGKQYLENSVNLSTQKKSIEEIEKKPFRYDVINSVLNGLKRETNYLEIGVRNPEDNFNKINATYKFSVDPGVEFAENPVDFKMTSDEFFSKLEENLLPIKNDYKFDVIFIDGLHLADQVMRDIENSLRILKDDGFLVLHDCNPPTEWHAREDFYFQISPARGLWNGTTWKAFYEIRKRNNVFSCCIDTDWGVGIISKKINFGESTTIRNDFFEFNILDKNRKETLNLITFEEFKKLI